LLIAFPKNPLEGRSGVPNLILLEASDAVINNVAVATPVEPFCKLEASILKL
jgi:hypothetical protein